MAEKKVNIEIGGDTSAAKASIKDLEQETKKSFEKMSTEAEIAADEVSKSFKRAGIRTEKAIRESSAKAKRDFKKIRDSGVASANDIKRAHNAMTAKLKKNSRELSTSSKRIVNIFKNIKGAIIAATAAAVGFFGVKVFGEAIKFESALLDLQKVMSDSEGQASQFTEVSEELAKKFGLSSAEVLQGAANFKQAGFDLQESFMLQEQALKLVIAGDIEAAEAAELLVSTLKGFKAPASEAARLTDVLNEVSNRYATNLQQLAIGMAEVSPIARIMGFTFEETAGLLTPIIEVFRSGTESSQAFRTGLLKLLDDALPVTNALRDLGVDQKELNGQMRSGKDIIGDVAQAFRSVEPNMKLVFATQIVGIRQAAKMVEVFDGLALSTEITNRAMKSMGSINKEVNIRLASTAIKGKRAAQSFNIMAKNLGNILLPIWNKLLDVAIVTFDVMAKGFNAVKRFIDNLPDFTRFLIPFLGLIKASKQQKEVTKELIKANDDFLESEEKIKKQLEESAKAFDERKRLRMEDSQAAVDAANAELASVSASIEAQQVKNKVIKEGITSVKKNLSELERELNRAQSFTEKVLASIAKSQKTIAQAGFDPLEKLVDDLARAREDFKKAVKEGTAGNIEKARELTLSAVEAANAILEVQKGAAAESEVTRSELTKATDQAEKLVESAKKFAVEMQTSAAEAIPAVKEQLAGLEADLIAGKDTLASLKADISVAQAQADKLKETLERDTTSTHTQVINTVNTGGTSPNIPGFSTGVKLPGYGGGDKILARLEAGERVIKKEAVRNLEGLGSRAMAALHQGDIKGLIDSLPVYQDGGKVESPDSSNGRTTNLNLSLEGKTFPMTTKQSVADELSQEIKNINVVRGRKRNPY